MLQMKILLFFVEILFEVAALSLEEDVSRSKF